MPSITARRSEGAGGARFSSGCPLIAILSSLAAGGEYAARAAIVSAFAPSLTNCIQREHTRYRHLGVWLKKLLRRSRSKRFIRAPGYMKYPLNWRISRLGRQAALRARLPFRAGNELDPLGTALARSSGVVRRCPVIANDYQAPAGLRPILCYRDQPRVRSR